jgi:Tfp pilus assembly protein PilZ
MSSPNPSVDRRTARRLVTQLGVDYKLSAVTGRGLTADISEAGLFICTDQDVTLGSHVLLKLHLSATKTLRILGEVVSKAIQSPVPGIGVAFTGIREDDKLSLRQFVSSRLPWRKPQSEPRYVAPSPRFELEWIPAGSEFEPQALDEMRRAPDGASRRSEVARVIGRRVFHLGLLSLPLLVVYLFLVKIGELFDSLIGAM